VNHARRENMYTCMLCVMESTHHICSKFYIVIYCDFKQLIYVKDIVVIIIIVVVVVVSMSMSMKNLSNYKFEKGLIVLVKFLNNK
jgi:hypothetical protein